MKKKKSLTHKSIDRLQKAILKDNKNKMSNLARWQKCTIVTSELDKPALEVDWNNVGPKTKRAYIRKMMRDISSPEESLDIGEYLCKILRKNYYKVERANVELRFIHYYGQSFSDLTPSELYESGISVQVFSEHANPFNKIYFVNNQEAFRLWYSVKENAPFIEIHVESKDGLGVVLPKEKELEEE